MSTGAAAENTYAGMDVTVLIHVPFCLATQLALLEISMERKLLRYTDLIASKVDLAHATFSNSVVQRLHKNLPQAELYDVNCR